ncbi:hypothetical protein V3C99_008593, partial [Haemonchus contortus]
RRKTDHAVWNAFEETIERKEDGYYVCFPRSKKLNSCLTTGFLLYVAQNLIGKLRTTTEILEQYQGIVQTQLDRNIIEQVDEHRPHNGDIVHYLPHCAVITPHKNTTKFRVVYDASAHLKNPPVPNDVLHRGPIRLPKLCDIILRFRIET